MQNFTPGSALLGGALIGLAATLLWLFSGRVAGISGIFAGIFTPSSSEFSWRGMFVLGLLGGGGLYALLVPGGLEFGLERSAPAIVISGLLVGFGARLGSGCTSGHGVCGVSALRKRSILSVLTFMAAGAVVVFLVNRLGGTL
jgi:uncharacterized membrane protein YedE/YeeE